MSERFSIDSNVLVYAANRSDPARHSTSRAIVMRAARLNCVLTLQSLAEFFRAITRKQIVPCADAAAQVERWLKLFPHLATASASALASAMAASAAGRFAFFDALLLATAGDAGCTAVLSEDMADGSTLGGVRIVKPFDRAGQMLPPARALLGLP